jgi:hypothetical protein
MGNYYAGSITIGGRLPANHLDEFFDTLNHERVTLEWGDTPFLPTSVEELQNALI